MSIVEEFEKLIKDAEELELINFLKSITKKDRISLTIHILDLFERLNNIYINETEKSFMHLDLSNSIDTIQEIQDDILTPIKLNYQKKLLSISYLVCFEEYEESHNLSLIYPSLDAFDKYYMASWCFPKFFCNHDYFIRKDYKKLLKCIEMNQTNYTNEYLAISLSRTTFNQISDIQEITLRIHIWFLFQYETDIQNHYDGQGEYWIKALNELANNKKLDKLKIIEEALLSTIRFSNRAITGYFFKMLETINPTEKELITLQDTLFMVLQSQHSKPINQTLKYLKRIYKKPSFNLNTFIEQVPVLLSWDVKAVVNGTLGLIDALIKHYPEHQKELSLLSIQTLAHQDESLQVKTIKLLQKHKLIDNQEIAQEIKFYQDNLFHSVKELLPEVESFEEKIDENILTLTPVAKIREDNRIPTYETFDDLVFFFSQILDENNHYDFDLFLDLLPKLDKKITQENVDILAPAFARAYKMYINWNTSESVSYNEIRFTLLSALIHYAEILIARLPKASKQIQLLSQKLEHFFEKRKIEREKEYERILDGKYYTINKNNSVRERHLERLKTEPCHGHRCLVDFEHLQTTNSVLYIFHHRVKQAFDKISKQNTLPNLSTPTHTPTFVALSTLIKKIQMYTDVEQLDPIDVQIALSRVINDLNSKEEIRSKVDGELGNLLYYLFSDNAIDTTQIKNPAYWQVAILRKRNKQDAKLFTKQFYPENPKYNILAQTKWHLVTVTRFHEKYNQFGHHSHYEKVQYFNQLKLRYKRTLLKSSFDSLFKHIRLNDITYQDITLTLLLFPLIPQYILEAIHYRNNGIFSYFYATEAEMIKYHMTMLYMLMEIWSKSDNELIYLFISEKIIDDNKSVRTLASELWIKAVSEGTMNHKLLGETLGKLEHNEYAPLKRFTDIVIDSMLNVSTLHNQALFSLLNAMLPQMNDEPIKGMKKLLEIYREVLSITNEKAPFEVLEKLKTWAKVKSLSVIVKKIGKC